MNSENTYESVSVRQATPTADLASPPISPAHRVLLMGFYGRGNFGDDLMGVALARFLQQHRGHQVTLMATTDNAHRHLQDAGIRIVPRSFKNVWRTLSEVDVLCQGGGTIFHDSYRGRYLVRYWMNLTAWLVLFRMARLKRVRVIVLGAGIGPIRHFVSRLISRLALASCSAISVRDAASETELNSLRVTTPFVRGFDLATLLPASQDPLPPEAGSRVLGVSACTLTPFLGSAELNERYWITMADALNEFAIRNNIHVRLLSLFTGSSSESDEAISDRIASRLAPQVSHDHFKYKSDPDQYIDRFRGCDWVIGAKFHAVIAAFLVERPCAIIPYNRKITDLANEIGIPGSLRISAAAVQDRSQWLQLFGALTELRQPATQVSSTQAATLTAEAVDQTLLRMEHP